MPIVNICDLKEKIQSVSASNRNPLYDSHIYWSQKPYNICNILIENLSSEGDIVFDPFLGSGVTLLEAIKNNRVGVGVEINEAPLFIVKTLLKQYDLDEFKRISTTFLKKIEKLLPYYYTTCPICQRKGVITSVVFDKESRDSNIKIKAVNYRCICANKGVKEADEKDYETINISETVLNITDYELLHNTKIAVYKGQKISQIFTGRNFTVLDKIVGIIKEVTVYNDVLRYILMSILHLCKITDKHSNSQWPLWIPKTDCVEKNIIDMFTKKLSKFQSTIKYLQENYNADMKYSLFHKGSQYIDSNDVQDGSVQLIITDPPYLGQVAYSEYMQLYKPFLSLDINLVDEIVVSTAPERRVTEDDYFKELEKVFKICSAKLVDNGFMCMYFHDCSLDVWNKLIAIMKRNKFSYLSQTHIKKGNTLKNIISPKKSLNGDAILFFYKDKFCFNGNECSEGLDEIELNVVKQARQDIKQYGPLSTPELYDGGIMEMLIQNGWLNSLATKYETLIDIFEKHLFWDSDIFKWKLNATD